MCLHDVFNYFVVFHIHLDLIHYFKSSFFSHGLDLADDLSYKTFFDQFRSQIGIQNNCDIVVRFGYITFHLRSFDQQIPL